MHTAFKDFIGRRDLYQLAQVHDAHPAGDVLDRRHAVRNKQVGHAVLLLQILEQIEYLRLDRHVERGNRFVADDQLRAQDQRAPDGDALALPA